MTGEMGLSDSEAVTYRALLRHQGSTVETLAEKLADDPGQVRTTLESLVRAGLVHSTDDDAWRAVSPEVGLRTLVTSREVALLRQQEELTLLRKEIDEFIADCRADVDPEYVGEELRGHSAILARVDELQLAARHSAEALVTSRMSEDALSQARDSDAALLERGVKVRNIYLDSIRNDRANMRYLAWYAEAGAEIRTLPALPVRMTSYDGEAVVIARSPDDHRPGAVILQGAGVMALVRTAFQCLWEAADPLFPGTNGKHDTGTAEPSISATDREVLRMLSSGATDDAVARRLDISDRTVRRMVADLCDRLDATGRFELGVIAGRWGWVGDAPRPG